MIQPNRVQKAGGWIVSGSCVPTLPVLGSLARVRSPSQVVGHSVIHQDLCKDSHCTPEHPILDYDEEKQTCICRSLDMFQIHLGGYLENKGSRLWQRKFLSRSAASMMFEPWKLGWSHALSDRGSTTNDAGSLWFRESSLNPVAAVAGCWLRNPPLLGWQWPYALMSRRQAHGSAGWHELLPLCQKRTRITHLLQAIYIKLLHCFWNPNFESRHSGAGIGAVARFPILRFRYDEDLETKEICLGAGVIFLFHHIWQGVYPIS